jgi:hypothetical protein
MKTILFILTAFLIVSSSLGQGKDAGDLKVKHVKDVKSTNAPVTRAEAQAVFEKAWKALATGLKAKGANPVKIPLDKNPITKNEVLMAFNAFVKQSRPMFKRSATKVAINVAKVRKDLDLKGLGKLIEEGFVMPVGPLVVGKNGSLTTYEFGDAVGVLLLRIADLAHLPSRKFTPALMPPDGV